MAIAPHPELSSLADSARSCLLARLTVSDKSGGKCSRCGRRFSGGRETGRERGKKAREEKNREGEEKKRIIAAEFIFHSIFQNAVFFLADQRLLTQIKHFPDTFRLTWKQFCTFSVYWILEIGIDFSSWKFSKQTPNLLKVFHCICGHFSFKNKWFACMLTPTTFLRFLWHHTSNSIVLFQTRILCGRVWK